MTKPQIPCVRDCPERSAECHAACEKYAEYRKAMDIYRDSEHEARKKDFVPRKKYTSWEARRYGKGGQR